MCGFEKRARERFIKNKNKIKKSNIVVHKKEQVAIKRSGRPRSLSYTIRVHFGNYEVHPYGYCTRRHDWLTDYGDHCQRLVPWPTNLEVFGLTTSVRMRVDTNGPLSCKSVRNVVKEELPKSNRVQWLRYLLFRSLNSERSSFECKCLAYKWRDTPAARRAPAGMTVRNVTARAASHLSA